MSKQYHNTGWTASQCGVCIFLQYRVTRKSVQCTNSTIIHGGSQFLEQWSTEYYNTWWTSLLGAVEHCNWEFVSAGYNWYQSTELAICFELLSLESESESCWCYMPGSSSTGTGVLRCSGYMESCVQHLLSTRLRLVFCVLYPLGTVCATFAVGRTYMQMALAYLCYSIFKVEITPFLCFLL